MAEQPTPEDKPPDPPPRLQQNISGHDNRIQGGNIIHGNAVFNSLPPHGAVFNGPVTIYNINPEARPSPTPPPSSSSEDVWPPYLYISSTGGAADHYCSIALGLYQLLPGITHEDKPVYRQLNDVDTSNSYLWCNSASKWRVTDELGSGSTYLRAKTSSACPTAPSWQYRHSVNRQYAVNGYSEDSYLTVTGMSQPPPACSILLSCSSPLPRNMERPRVLGQYEATGQYHLGRRVYRHTSQELYLAVRCLVGWYGYRGWAVRSELSGGDAYLRSGIAPTMCPADQRVTRNDWHWGYRNNKRDKWSDLPELVVKCSTHANH